MVLKHFEFCKPGFDQEMGTSSDRVGCRFPSFLGQEQALVKKGGT